MLNPSSILLEAVPHLRPPPSMRPSRWAAEFRVLPREQSAFPGRWQNERTPYLQGIMDACAEEGVEQVVVCKCAQAGVSEAIRNVIGWAGCQEPDPFLYVMPSEQAANSIFRKRILPMLNDTPALRALLSSRLHDVSLQDVTLRNGFTLTPGWSGSPQTLATDPRRFVFFDEVDKYPPYSGREADPVSLGLERTDTYEDRRKIIAISTPTTRLGQIHRMHEACERKRTYRCPCPECGTYQVLAFSQIKWPQAEDTAEGVRAGPGFPERHAANIEYRELAWYECEACSERLTDEQRKEMVRRGVWACEGLEVDEHGQVLGEEPSGVRVGFHVWRGMVLWRSIHQIAAEFIRSKDHPDKLQNFRNSWLGEVHEEQVARTSLDDMRAKLRAGHQERVIPGWAHILLASADCQKDHFWYVLRAWGYGYRSRLVREGRAESFEELALLTLETEYDMEGTGPGLASFIVVDSGYRTDEVYAWCEEEPERRLPIRGYGGKKPPKAPVWLSRVSYRHPGERAHRSEVVLRTLDTTFFQDRLARHMARPDDEPGAWELHAGTTEEYLHQVTSMHKVMVREGTREPYMMWVPITAGRANHLRDCEVYQFAAAEVANVGSIPSPEALEEQRRHVTRKDGGGWLQGSSLTGGAAWKLKG